MSTSTQQKHRAVSARLVSAIPSMQNIQLKNKKYNQKTQLFDHFHALANSNHTLYQKNKLFNIKANIKQNQFDQLTKMLPKQDKISKQKQQLFKQNLYLKKQLNQLKQQLQKSRTKIDNLIQKNKKYTIKFNRQFQKKIYWNTSSTNGSNNTYLISGIKAQYQRIKQQYQQKQFDYQLLKKQFIQSKLPQYKIYSENLQSQNRKLAQQINRLTSQLKDNSNHKDKYINLQQIKILQQKNQKLKANLQQFQQQNNKLTQINNQSQQKIAFLQKSLIQKNNSEYKLLKKYKKLQRQKVLLDNNIKSLEKQNQELIKNYQLKIDKFKLIQQKKSKIQKDTFNKTLCQKDIENQKLKKQVAYLSTLLTYWKPLDQLKDYNIQQQHSSYHHQHPKKQDHSKKKQQQDYLHTRKISKQLQQSQKNLLQHSLKQSIQFSQQIKLQHHNTKSNRIQQTSDQKHNQCAEKKRKVQYKQVQHIGENLKYRFLGLRLHIDDVRKYFDYDKQFSNPQNQYILTDQCKEEEQKEKPWEEEYITMQQVKQILKNYPFQLSQQQSTLLARYMIEDSLKQYVYVDPKNEHKRSIVKSIIKALVGSYQLLSGDKHLQIQKQCKSMLQKYQPNLFSALSQTSSTGYITHKKFIQLLNSLGIQLSQQGKDYLVCKMLLKSKSLNQLDYMIIF